MCKTLTNVQTTSQSYRFLNVGPVGVGSVTVICNNCYNVYLKWTVAARKTTRVWCPPQYVKRIQLKNRYKNV